LSSIPELTPPQVEVSASYTGASANVVAKTVASLLESQINGVDYMIYISSGQLTDRKP
jgi:Cation/multidrug efflux pump